MRESESNEMRNSEGRTTGNVNVRQQRFNNEESAMESEDARTQRTNGDSRPSEARQSSTSQSRTSTEKSARPQRSGRGFASMDPERQREIARKGGRAAHQKGTAHQWSSDEAREAGRKGGTIVSRDREHMATIGREGGASAHRRSRKQGDKAQEQERSRGEIERAD
jgi:uncharacterized protein